MLTFTKIMCILISLALDSFIPFAHIGFSNSVSSSRLELDRAFNCCINYYYYCMN